MTYKLFQNWYHEADIKHLLLYVHNGNLISPPFATKKCEDYNKIMKFDGCISYIDTDLEPGTSKTSAVITVGGSSWFIPYGIYDELNTVLQLKDDVPIHHKIKGLGKGQFYSAASNGTEGFSFPLGYDNTQYGIYIKDDNVSLIPFEHSVTKAHMGTVYCNGRFWSMPRGDEPGYTQLVSFDGNKIEKYNVPVNPNITRKFTDIVVVGNTLYSLPFGEQLGLTSAVEFNTDTLEMKLHDLNIPDFAKKYNSMILCSNVIIGLPYGDEKADNSNWGIVFNTDTKESKSIDIKIGTGGKYRYRAGIEFNGHAWFFPVGTPNCPVIVINIDGEIVYQHKFNDIMFGRPVVYQNKIAVLTYNIETTEQRLMMFDHWFHSMSFSI
jgi:hypothetical protein